MADVAPRDQNYKAVIQGVSSVDHISPTNIWVNPSSHAMLVEVTSGGGGGTQYAEGDTDSPATGTVALGRYNATPPSLSDGELFALQFDSAGKLLVSASLTPSGTQDVNLTEVGGSAFALGQQLAAASLPIVLTAAQISTLTPLSTVAVTQSTSPWVVAGSGTAGTANAGVVTVQGIASMTPILSTLQTQTDTVMVGGVNIKEINAVTPLMGNGTTGTGSQRVTIASNNTAFSVNPLSATTPVSTMNSASANSGVNSAMAAVFDDTTPTSITENSFGFLRMSANRNQYVTLRDAAGNERGLNVDANGAIAVTATNATASNLKVAATLDAETTKVIGTVRIKSGGGTAYNVGSDNNNDSYDGSGAMQATLLGSNGTNFDRVRTGLYTSAATAVGSLQDIPLLQYNSSAPTITNAFMSMLQGDVNANLKQTLGTLIAGENLTTNRLNVEPVYSYANMTTGTTTTIKNGAGTLHAIIVNTAVASATIKLFDNTAGSGTSIGAITLGGTLATDPPTTLLYDISFATGLTIITSGATDITIAYR